MTTAELLALLKSKYGSVKQSNKGWYMIKCPTCAPRDAHKMRRGVNFDLMMTKCWICQEHMYVKDLFGQNIERVSDSVVIPTPEHPQAKIIPAKSVIPINELPEEHPAIQFFIKDHLTEFDRYWNEQKIGYITKEAAIPIIYKHDDRPDTTISPKDSLVFPVYYKGELIGWQLRYIPGTPKFRYLHIFQKGEHLYNYDIARAYEMVVVTEGVKKSLKFPNGVATFGKSISENQIQKLMNWKKIVFLYDGEDDTQTKAKELVKLIGHTKKCINIDPRKYGYPSPDEMSKDVAQQIVYKEWIDTYGN